MVIWIVGLSGSGKTTIGLELYRMWKAQEPNTVMVDGDDMRRLFGRDTAPADYTLERRRKNAERIVAICEWLDQQDINVVCCILCLFEDIMRENRARFSRYLQVHVDAPLDVLKQRDPKGLYARAMSGAEKNVVGLDIPFPVPPESDLTLFTGPGAPPPPALAHQIMQTAGIAE